MSWWIQGLTTCMSILKIDTDKLVKTLGVEGNNKAVLISYYHGMLGKLARFTDLYDLFSKMIAEDPTITETYENWLEDSFGHRDKDVFIDVMMGHVFGKQVD
jgi:hypothetical protein